MSAFAFAAKNQPKDGRSQANMGVDAMSTRHMPDTIIVGRPIAPKTSWWIYADGPAGFTAYVEAKQLKRMRSSKFSELAIRPGGVWSGHERRARELPSNDDYVMQSIRHDMEA